MKKNTSIPIIGLAIAALFLWAGCDAGIVGPDAGELSNPAIMKSWSPDPGQEIVITPEAAVLMARRGATEGNVGLTLSDDGDNLLLTFTTGDKRKISRIQVWVGTDPNDVPKTRRNIPIPGKFPYKASKIKSPVHTMSIPTDNLGPLQDGQTYYVFAHVDFKHGGSAWAGSTKWESRRWAYYFSFLVTLTGPVGPPPAEDAFALGTYSFEQFFTETGTGDIRWGWISEIYSPAAETVPIYAGAEFNDTTIGTIVGELSYTFSGTVLTATYNLEPGFTLMETHLYASEKIPDKLTALTPSQYTVQSTHSNLASFTYSVPINLEISTDPIYLIAHATVSGDFAK